MKKLIAIMFAVALLVCMFSINASAAALVVDYDYIVDAMQDAGGYLYLAYEFPERPELSNNPFNTDLLWVDIWVFEAGTEPAEGQEFFDLLYSGTINDQYKLKKTENDDQFLPSERWIGPVFDDAESVYLFETGKTYNIYFGCCNGAEWYYYSKPYTFEYTETDSFGGAAGDVTEAPSESVDDVTEAPSNGPNTPDDGQNGFPIWIIIAGAVVVVAVVVVVIIVASKKKKAE